jgi:hypothetical protein
MLGSFLPYSRASSSFFGGETTMSLREEGGEWNCKRSILFCEWLLGMLYMERFLEK